MTQQQKNAFLANRLQEYINEYRREAGLQSLPLIDKYNEILTDCSKFQLEHNFNDHVHENCTFDVTRNVTLTQDQCNKFFMNRTSSNDRLGELNDKLKFGKEAYIT